MQADPWPAPFHLGRAMLAAHYLRPAEKLRVLRGLAALLRTDPQDDPPLEPWLRRQGQTPRTIERFWNVILVSALNSRVEEVGRKYARKVFVDGMLRHREGWVVHVPVVPLDRLYGAELEAFCRRHGVVVRLNAAVRRLHAGEGGTVAGLELRDGSQLQADHYILAVPFPRVRDLLPPAWAESMPYFFQIAQLSPSPICSVHLWFDRPVLPWPHVAVVDGWSQWLFRRPTPSENGSEHYVQVIISAADKVVSWGQERLQAAVVEELRQMLPLARAARLLRSRVIIERTATFRPVPGVDRWRPPQESPIANLALAGDYTATDWPATMEGAVRSGFLAAEVVLRRLGRPRRLLQPDLG